MQHRRRGQRASAHRQGLRAGARAGGRRVHAIARFEALGYSVVHGASDWVMGPEDRHSKRNSGRMGTRRARYRRVVVADTTAWLARRRAAVDARMLLTPCRSRRFLRYAECHTLSRQIAVEQYIVLDLMHAYRHAWRLIGTFERRQDQARASGAQDDRRDRHMQPVETSGNKKARYGISAAFDQDPAHAAASERDEDGGGRDLAIGVGQCDHFDTGGRRTARALRSDQQAPDAVVSEKPGIGA